MPPAAQTAHARKPRPPVRRTQVERSEATVSHLVATARDLFATRGFADTSIEDIVRAAGVTRGALYHHFENKTELFRAVVEAEARRLSERVVAAAQHKRDPWKQVEIGALAFLDACVDPDVQRILLIDAASVLGWAGLREIESRSTMALLTLGIENSIREKKLRRRDPEALTSILFGAMCELSMVAARASDQGAALASARKELQALLRDIAA
jgi:AcrR family transcriptional regulator